MAPLGRLLDVLRIEVAAAEDDQVLDPAGDVELAVVQEAEVAGPQERAVAVGGAGAERLLGIVGPLPVALGDARAADPDLARPIGRAGD